MTRSTPGAAAAPALRLVVATTFVATCLLAGTSRSAAAAELDRTPIVQLEEVEVTLHYVNSVGTSDAASAGAITRQLIEDRPILRPGEVLELVPGLIITQHSGAGKANQYYLRGFNLDHGTDFATTLDGMPLNLRTHAHGQGYTDLNFLIPELIERVDYYKGPYFAAKGDFASAGAADIHYSERLRSSLVELTGGSFKYLRAVAAGSPELLDGRLTYGLEFMHDDGPWDHPDDYRRYTGVVRYSHPLGGGDLTVTAMGYRGTWNATDQIPLGAVSSGLIGLYGSLDPTTGGNTFRYSLSGGWRGEVGGGVLEASLYAVRYQLRLYSNFTYYLDDPVHGDQVLQADNRWLYGSSGSWSYHLDLAPTRHDLRAGWEARGDRILPVGLFHTEVRQILETIRLDDVVETSGGVYAEVDSHWLGWLRTLMGARYDEFRFDVSSSRGANSGVVTAGRASPKASAILGPWGSTELFVNWGLGFHSNDARGATMKVDPTEGVTPVAPVTALVKTRGDEIGVRAEIVPGVQSSLSLWELAMGSELLFTGDAGTTEPSRPSHRQGLEWSTRWRPLKWLLFDLDVAVSKARFTQADPVGQFIPGAIEKAVSAGATVHELGPLTASVFLRYFGPRPLIEDNSIRSSGATILNAQATYRVVPHVRLALECLNFTDAKVDDIAYWYTSRTTPTGEAKDDMHVHPTVGRSVRLSLTLTD